MSTEVPFFQPDIGELEIREVAETLRSGWLTTGPRVRRFEREFAAAVGAQSAVAVNSCTGALHLALESLALKPGQGVLVPTMTFAATAEVVRYLGGVPILVDCDADTAHMDLSDAAAKSGKGLDRLLPAQVSNVTDVVGMMPVHVGGLMMNMAAVKTFAERRSLWVVEDAAHAFPAAWRERPDRPWQRCGEDTADVTCFSFYANKTITTGEGGMAVTGDPNLAERIRQMSLHGLSRGAWDRYSAAGEWDYLIEGVGFKYNLTDVAAAIGLHQLARAEEMRRHRERIARRYTEELAGLEEIELPPDVADRIHAWHLFAIRLNLERLRISRNDFIIQLRQAGVASSVHWRPLHLHPYYHETFGYRPEHCPTASALFERLVSLPIGSKMTDEQIQHVIDSVYKIVERHSSSVRRARRA